MLSTWPCAILFFSVFFLSANADAQVPANDVCADAIPIAVNSGWVPASNLNTVTNGPNLSCGGGTMIRDVWFSFVYPGGTVSITTQLGTLADTRLGVRASCEGPIIACNDDFSGMGLASRIDLTCNQLTIGTTYYIQAGGYNGQTGNFSIQVAASGVGGCTDPNANNYNPCAGTNNGSCTYDAIQAGFSAIPATGCEGIQMSFTSTSTGNVASYMWSFPGGTPSTSNLPNPVVSYPLPGIYPASLTVSDPQGDQSSINQNISVSERIPFQVVINPDNYPNETSWKLFNAFGIEVAGGGAVGASLCIDAGTCYSFVIYDSYGDGICCVYGQGSYQLFLDGVQVASGGLFGSSETTSVNCMPGTDCNHAIPVEIGVHTAPFTESWFSFTPSVNGQYNISTCFLGSCNTTIWMYDYCNMNNFGEDNAATLTYNNGFCEGQAQVTPMLVGGTEYWIRIRWEEDPNSPCIREFNVEYIGPLSGCMNLLACNYDPIAEVPGPCYFNDDPNCSNLGPDLRIRGDVFFNSMFLTTINAGDACLVNEGCVQGFGQRQVVRFTTWIDNIGTQDYYIGNPNQGTGQFEWDPCHNHWHYEGYAEYVLFDENGFEMPQIGFKNGFCVLDLTCPAGGVAKYTCGNMGITAGCADYYSSGLQCQWVDITDVPAGTYTLVTRVNWDQSPDANGRYELRHDNNWSAVCISFGRDANNNIVNFTKSLECGVPIDCLGQPFGSSIPDCEGNCPGVVTTGDLDSNNELTMDDVMLYLSGIVGGGIAPTTCNDLNADGAVSVIDAALAFNCAHFGDDHVHDGGTHNHCIFGLNILNPEHTVTLIPAVINPGAGYFDVYVLNPDCKVAAYEFEVTGATVTGVASIVTGATFDVIHMASATKVVGMAQHNFLPKNYSPTPLIRVFYSAITAPEVCINPIVDIVNEDTHRVNTIAGPCLSVTSQTFADFSAEPTQVCVGSTVQFTDLSTNSPISWQWSFPGGTPAQSTAQNPVVTYLLPGIYSVSLTVSNGNQSDSKTMMNYIEALGNAPICVDCFGDLGGMAYIDACGNCVGGNTGLQPCPTCPAQGGTISTLSQRLNLCVGDGFPNIVQLSITGNTSPGRFGLVRQSDLAVIATNTTGVFNMENYPAGQYFVGYVAVESMSQLQGITNLNQLSGCYNLSNQLAVSSMPLSGGTIAAVGPTSICTGSITFTRTGHIGPNFRWAVLNQEANMVLSQNTTGVFDFSLYGAGTYRVVHFVYSNAVNLNQVSPPNTLPCMAVSNQVTVQVQPCPAEMQVNPNPTQDVANVYFVPYKDSRARLELLDLSGRLIDTYFEQMVDAGQSYSVQISGSNLPNGVYLLRLIDGYGTTTKKFIIAR